jgi:hypothetical protein
MNDSDVIRNAQLMAKYDDRAVWIHTPHTQTVLQVTLTPPHLCPPQIVSIMYKCWCFVEHQRPTFDDIHNQLTSLHPELPKMNAY